MSSRISKDVEFFRNCIISTTSVHVHFWERRATFQEELDLKRMEVIHVSLEAVLTAYCDSCKSGIGVVLHLHRFQVSQEHVHDLVSGFKSL